jgi:TonB-dependent receptor
VIGRSANKYAWAFGASSVVLAFAASAAAQAPAPAKPAAATANGAPVQEIVVTGFRSSLQKALVGKRNSAISEDTILAEDIGKFPDLNLSESIQRIPGVAITRDGGEGRQISVRGLGPQFTRVRINGMEALATTGSSDASGGVNRGRNFDFNVFASDLFNSITVEKTAAASTEEGSLGATVDLLTARPFDYRKFAASASVMGDYNDLAKTTSPRVAGMVTDTWADGKVGLLLSAAYSHRKYDEDGSSTVRWATGNAFSPGFLSAPAGTSLAAVNAAYHPRFPRYEAYHYDQERLGLTGSLQLQPTDHTRVTIDALYADFKGIREEQQLEAPSFSVGGACTTATTASGACGIAQTGVTAATIDANNTLIKGTFNNVDLRTENRYVQYDTKFSQFDAVINQDITDKIRATGTLGYSVSDYTNPYDTTLTFDQFNIQNYSYDFNSRLPVIGYGNANLTSPSAWVLTQIRLRPNTAKNTYSTAKGDLNWDLNDTWTFTGGVDYKRYTFNTTAYRRSNGTATNLEPTIPTAVAAIPTSSFSKSVTLGGTTTIIPSDAAAASVLSLYDPTAYNFAYKLGPEPALTSNYQVNENDLGGYAQADFKTELAHMPFKGNFGVRFVETDQYTAGYTFVGGAPAPIANKRSYNDTLPSLNLSLEPVHNFLLRFSAAKVMSRPDLGSLQPGASVTVSGATRTVSAGNPNLNPFRANAYDLSGEWYFAPGGLLSLAVFRKDINSLVQTVTTTTTFTGNPFGLPDSVAIAACGSAVGCSPSSQWTFTNPVNTAGNTLNGLEVNYQQAFTFLPGLLKKTGALINYTYVQSRVGYVNSQGVVIQTGDLTGLSRNAYNATVYYEDDKWSGRVSVAYRDQYYTRIPGQETGTTYDGTNATFNLDMSVQYTINKNFKVMVQGVNLTDQYQDQYNNFSNLVSVYHHTGREILFGFRYNY